MAQTIVSQMGRDEQKVLHSIYSLALPTRLSVIAFAGLSNGRVTQALRSLRENETIVSTEETPQGQGRPSTIHRISRDAFFAVGAALEVGSCTIAAVSGSGETLRRADFPPRGPRSIRTTCARCSSRSGTKCRR